MKKVLIAVDVQNDFVNGSLGTAEAEKIIPEVVKAINDPSYDQIFVTLDTHPENYLETFEGKHLPVAHCIRGTDGWKLNPEVEKALQGKHPVIIEKPTFGSMSLVQYLTNIHPDEIVLTGLCTDICVISNALLLRAALYETKIGVIEKACAGVTPEKHQAALEVMRSCQIDIL